MEAHDILRHRLINQQLAGTTFKKPDEIVRWMAAMQAQEFAHAKWAIGLRLPSATDAEVEACFNKGKILRTHILRPTWHFVAPEDIRWLITLTSPRVNAANTFMYKKLELDQKVFKATSHVLEKMLQGGKHLTREILNQEFGKKKIVAKGLRLGYIFMRAELDGLICSGPREGKQFTYALLEERVPPAKVLNREEGLAELSRRYFISRGPATIRDFVTWSGLTMKEAKQGISSLPKDIIQDRTGEQEYVYKEISTGKVKINSTFIMPDYDEYGMSYKDRSALMPAGKVARQKLAGSSDYTHWLIVEGVMGGSWKKTEDDTVIDVTTFERLGRSQQQEVKRAVDRYKAFASRG